MEIIDRYVYAVVSKLPEKQRDDIEREIRTLIDDMIDNYPSEEDELSKVRKVLLEIGDPNILAENYMDKKRYIISPKNYDRYKFILKIVLGAVFLGTSVAIVIGGIFSHEKDIITTVSAYVSSIISALAQSFTWVTLIFIIAEHKGIDFTSGTDKKKKWSVNDLPKIPSKEAIIPRSGSIVGILFSTIFMNIFYFAPQLFGAHIQLTNGEYVVIPIFDISVLREYRILILGIFIIAIAREVLKLIYGKWTIKLAFGYSFLSIISLVLVIVVFFNLNIWNSSFGVEIANYINIEVDFPLIWEKIMSTMLIFIIVINILEIGSVIYKGIKYNSSRS